MTSPRAKRERMTRNPTKTQKERVFRAAIRWYTCPCYNNNFSRVLARVKDLAAACAAATKTERRKP